MTSSHDKVNLNRLVQKLQQYPTKSTSVNSQQEWLRVQATLQKIKYARKLLGNVRERDGMYTSQQQDLDEVDATLDRLESAAKAASQSYAPEVKRPSLILPTIPKPSIITNKQLSPPPAIHISNVISPGGADTSRFLEIDQTPLASGLLLTPDDAFMRLPSPMVEPTSAVAAPPMPFTRIPSSGGEPAPAAKPKSIPSALQNSAAVQEELQQELARMATQLRKNTEHFSKVLEKDRALVEGAGEKLESNLTTMQSTRIRLRDRGIAARGNTCFTVAALVGVIVAFVAMVLVIRVTSR